jgi:hypothetical protein
VHLGDSGVGGERERLVDPVEEESAPPTGIVPSDGWKYTTVL